MTPGTFLHKRNIISLSLLTAGILRLNFHEILNSIIVDKQRQLDKDLVIKYGTCKGSDKSAYQHTGFALNSQFKGSMGPSFPSIKGV